jgi:hypothetical protein
MYFKVYVTPSYHWAYNSSRIKPPAEIMLMLPIWFFHSHYALQNTLKELTKKGGKMAILYII